jgi:asparagine synthase (glutamine-hydrolysing)
VSGIFGIFGYAASSVSEAVSERVLAGLTVRGGDRTGVWRDGSAVVGVARAEWETVPALAGIDLALADSGHALVADASLYYRADLRSRLVKAGHPEDARSSSELILAAYRAWGENCAETLEGDFAFILWDQPRGRVVCARDHSGVRPLFFAEVGEALVVGSTLRAILSVPGVSDELDLENVALDAAGIIFAHRNGTCYRAIRAVPAGATLTWQVGGRSRIRSWWDPRVRNAERRTDERERAEELRRLLADAVEQRFDESRPTSLWLSGGWDSTALYAAGQERLAPSGATLRPISVGYPAGDSARENDLIEAVIARWPAPHRWVDGAEIPLMEAPPSAARGREEPYAMPFEGWLRSVAAASAASGGRVALNGHGGNFLFDSSPAYLADLMASGRLVRLAREWRAMGVQERRAAHFLRWAVVPLLPRLGLLALERVRGRRVHGTYERPLPGWLAPDFVTRHGLAERAREATPRARRGSRSAHELEWFMTHPAFPRLNALTHGFAFEEGIELRVPLYDARIIRFVAAGPWSERHSMGESKRLLRRSVAEVLPQEVLRTRKVRTGTLATYFDRSMKVLLPVIVELFGDPVSGQLGLIDPAAMRRDIERFASGRGHQYLREQILSAAHAESWLRERLGSKDRRASEVPIDNFSADGLVVNAAG